MSFRPRRIILTSVESDHQDYFPDYKSIRDAFADYCRLLPKGGQLIYCADDPGASEVARIIEEERRGVELVPYGFSAPGDYRVVSYRVGNERAVFSLAGFSDSKGSLYEFKLRIPGRHEALNAAAALALTSSLAKDEFGVTETTAAFNEEKILSIKNALENFKSTKRRSEIIGEVPSCKNGTIIFMDDYGHHPTAIKTTLAGIRDFYPSRRLIVSFMSHTYTRTSALLDEFVSAFNDADVLFLHKIYASARENFCGNVDGKILYEKTRQKRLETVKNTETYYIDEPDDAFEPLCEMLKEGDIFITLGAGNNWTLAEKLCARFKSIYKEGLP